MVEESHNPMDLPAEERVETPRWTGQRIPRGSEMAVMVQEAFESGDSLDRIARTTFQAGKHHHLEFILFAIGGMVAIFGGFPVIKYLVEGGGLMSAIIGGFMLFLGICTIFVAAYMDARRSEEFGKTYQAHHDRVRRNLLDRFFE
jgi:hypothetical protein